MSIHNLKNLPSLREVRQNLVRWAEALESGEYQQAKEFLCQRNGFCCLGVACEVFEIPSEIVSPENEAEMLVEKEESRLLRSYEGSVGYPPESLLERIPLSATTVATLINLNDESGWTFGQIAELVRWIASGVPESDEPWPIHEVFW